MKTGVILARFQPIHNGHLQLIQKAVEENDKVLVIIGSIDKLNARNPIPWTIRKEMERINPVPKEYRQWKHRCWGDKIDITRLNPNGTFRIVGWLPQRPKHGDKLIYDAKSGHKAVGYIVNVEYCRNPRDMFFADVIPFEYYQQK